MTDFDPNQLPAMPYPQPVPPPDGYPAPDPGAYPYPPPAAGYPSPYPQPPAHPYQGMPSVPYPPYPAAPTRKRRGWLVAGLVVVVVAVVVLAGAGSAVVFLVGDKTDPVKTAASVPGTSVSAGATPTPTATPAPTTQAGTTKLSATQLHAALVPYPSGTRKIIPSGTSNGIMSLSQFAKREYDDQQQAIDYLHYHEFSTAVTGPLTGGLDGYYFQFNAPGKDGWRYITTYAQIGKIVVEAEYDSKSALTSNDLGMVLKLTKDQGARIT